MKPNAMLLVVQLPLLSLWKLFKRSSDKILPLPGKNHPLGNSTCITIDYTFKKEVFYEET
jgi:hypothetical protein